MKCVRHGEYVRTITKTNVGARVRFVHQKTKMSANSWSRSRDANCGQWNWFFFARNVKQLAATQHHCCSSTLHAIVWCLVNVRRKRIFFNHFWNRITQNEEEWISQYLPMKCIPISRWTSSNSGTDWFPARPIDDRLNSLRLKWPAQLLSSTATHPMQWLSAFSTWEVAVGVSEAIKFAIYWIGVTITTLKSELFSLNCWGEARQRPIVNMLSFRLKCHRNVNTTNWWRDMPTELNLPENCKMLVVVRTVYVVNSRVWKQFNSNSIRIWMKRKYNFSNKSFFHCKRHYFVKVKQLKLYQSINQLLNVFEFAQLLLWRVVLLSLVQSASLSTSDVLGCDVFDMIVVIPLCQLRTHRTSPTQRPTYIDLVLWDYLSFFCY